MTNCCRFPFERIYIESNGIVYFCSSPYCKEYSIGNIFTDEIDDIWYSKKAEEFRKSILDGSYKYCNLSICGNIYNDAIIQLDNTKDNTPPYPKVVYLGYSRGCNTRCIICRDELITETKEETEKFNTIADKIIRLCQNAEIIYLNGGGELFTSPHFKFIIKQLTSTYSHIKFIIHTNGTLCDEIHIRDWGLENRITNINVSIHAATKETYKSVVRGGHWEQLQKNLKYISTLKCPLNLCFVLHSLNYKEMPAFVKMANKFGATALFWKFKDWGNLQMSNNIEKYACWKPYHPDYKNFLKVLNKLKRMKKYKYILTEEFLRVLQSQTTDPWWVKFTKFFNF